MVDVNRDIYEKADIVEGFSTCIALHRPEETIFQILKPNLEQMRMLDMGVGTGRTTRHFAPLVKEYVGVDYSENMITKCRQQFRESERISFAVINARDLSVFDDGSFDFVNFSFNGLDYLDHEGRGEALAEIKRVCSPGGFFSFSTHNLYSIRRFLSVDWALLKISPKGFLRRLLYIPVLKTLNEPLRVIKKKDYAIFRDGDLSFSLRTYYVKPERQIEKLLALGFENIRMFLLETGKEIDDSVDFSLTGDYYFYFLCNKIKKS